MEDQELRCKSISLSAYQTCWAASAKSSPLHPAVGISSFDPTTPLVSNSQGKRTRPMKELRAISVKDSSRLHFSASSMKPQYCPLSMEFVKRVNNFNPLLSTQRRSFANPRSSVGSSSLSSTSAAMLSNSQGKLVDKLTRLRKECDQTMDLYKSACHDDQAMSAAEKGELKDKLTKLLKEFQQTMFDVDLYNLTCKELQQGADYFNNFDFQAFHKYHGLKGEIIAATTSGENMNSDVLRLVTKIADVAWQREAVFRTNIPEEPKGAGTSKRERLKGEGEDDVTVRHEGELEENLTRLKEKQYKAISAEPVYHVACNSATEMRKYEAGSSSKGKERMEGEGENDAAAQYADRRSLPKEEPRDDELLIPIPSQPHDFALPQRVVEEGGHNCALPLRAEAGEHNCALSQRTEPQRAEEEGICALSQRAAEGELDCTPTVSKSNPNITNNYIVNVFNFGNQSITPSPPSGLSNRANPNITQNFFSSLISISKYHVGN